MSDELFYKKYLKYKNKYLELKNQIGHGLLVSPDTISIRGARGPNSIFGFLGYVDASLNLFEPAIYEAIDYYFDGIEKYFRSTGPYQYTGRIYRGARPSPRWHFNSYKDNNSFISDILYKDKTLVPYLSDHRPIWDISTNSISWNVDENDIEFFKTLAYKLSERDGTALTDFNETDMQNFYNRTFTSRRNRIDLLNPKAHLISLHINYIIDNFLDKSKQIIINLQETSGELSQMIYTRLNTGTYNNRISYDFIPQVLMILSTQMTGPAMKAAGIRQGQEDDATIKRRLRFDVSTIYNTNIDNISRTGFGTFIIVPRTVPATPIINFKLKPALMKLNRYKYGDCVDGNRLEDWPTNEWGYNIICRAAYIDICEMPFFNIHLDKKEAISQLTRLFTFKNNSTFDCILDYSWTISNPVIESHVLELVKNELTRINSAVPNLPGKNRLFTVIRGANEIITGYDLDERNPIDKIVAAGDLNITKKDLEVDDCLNGILKFRGDKSTHNRENPDRYIDYLLEGTIIT